MNKRKLLKLYKNTDLLLSKAAQLRTVFFQNNIELCSILNAKSGNCFEDCKFCSQSVFHNTNITKHKTLSLNKVLNIAKKMESFGVKRFSLVTSGKSLSKNDLEKLIPIYKELKKKTKLLICASHGLLDKEKAQILKSCGVTTYHHNIETSERNFNNICTTHNYQDRINTILNAKDAGLNVCSGGIIGLGESEEDRINMALELKKLNIKSIPINILIPIKGTALEKKPTMTPDDIIKTTALFRYINHDAVIRLAGGRKLLNNNINNAFTAGINGLMVGDYLTTSGNKIKKDLKIIIEKGFNII